MKRILCVLLLVCLLPVWGLGEELPEFVPGTLPFGLKLGMTREEALAQMESAGIVVEEEEWAGERPLISVPEEDLTRFGYPVQLYLFFDDENTGLLGVADILIETERGYPLDPFLVSRAKWEAYLEDHPGEDILPEEQGLYVVDAPWEELLADVAQTFTHLVTLTEEQYGLGRGYVEFEYKNSDGSHTRPYLPPMRDGRVDFETIFALIPTLASLNVMFELGGHAYLYVGFVTTDMGTKFNIQIVENKMENIYSYFEWDMSRIEGPFPVEEKATGP